MAVKLSTLAEARAEALAERGAAKEARWHAQYAKRLAAAEVRLAERNRKEAERAAKREARALALAAKEIARIERANPDGRCLFTPRYPNGRRLRLHIAPADLWAVRRGDRWRATVTDLDTGTVYDVRDADCGEPYCRCDAEIIGKPRKAA